MPTHKPAIPLLQNRIPLFRFFCMQLGAETGFSPLRELLKNARQGYADDGHSHFYHAIATQSGLKISTESLSLYDLRIKRYVERLNQGRVPPVRLLYFQWVGVLFSEMFLDRLFGEPSPLRRELNSWLNTSPTDSGVRFGDRDLGKVAYWMATGSGKTLIMHINFWQVQYYAQRAGRQFDNVLLITPNDGLSSQHLSELAKSGIPARHYSETAGSLFAAIESPVTVIEVTKLTENKRGGGLTMDVEAFGSNNLLFVDEGHRGASGEVWRTLRDRVAERGFTFEYSATFGQIVNGASPDEKRKALLQEYSRAILFDYSYPHFYDDGYGKDYWVVNVRDETDAFNESVILANLLSFFEQVIVFDEYGEVFRPFAIERPLWVFVGHSVTGGKTREDQLSLTDVEQIVAFFDKFLKQSGKWTERIQRLLSGQSGLRNLQGDDIFHDRFAYLKQKGWRAEQIYRRVVQRVFDGRPGETLRASRLKTAEGEIGLRVGADRPYFGVINVGDVLGLTKLLEVGGISCDDDSVHASSLFDEVNEPHSPVNVLIGARKFMEGWDSFRVASMGLMNIGRGEGSQIIQLFGRGVRLHGRGYSLKRSSGLEAGATPKQLHLLETLNVFGMRANYMQRFREELQREGIDPDSERIDVPIRLEDFIDHGLQVLRLPDGVDFVRSESVIGSTENGASITLDLRPKLELADSVKQSQTAERAGGTNRADRLKELAPLLNWQRIYFELTEYKRLSELWNLVFTSDALRRIVQRGSYTLYCSDTQLAPGQFGDLWHTEEIACAVLRKYLARLYDHAHRSWEQEKLLLRDLTTADANLSFQRYEVTTKGDLAKIIRKLVKEAGELYEKDTVQFPTIHFGRHLYQPLLAFDKQDRYKSTPQPLNEGETRFVLDLRAFLQENPNELDGRDVFLLRNLSRGHGIGFFTPKDGEAFYPDFILWVIEDGRQTIAFIDPHGLGRARGLKDPKIQLHQTLAKLQPSLQGHKKWDVRMTSFIVSPTPYDIVRRTSWVYSCPGREELEAEHVLFQEVDSAYVKTMWDRMNE